MAMARSEASSSGMCFSQLQVLKNHPVGWKVIAGLREYGTSGGYGRLCRRDDLKLYNYVLYSGRVLFFTAGSFTVNNRTCMKLGNQRRMV
jgi:hypothetical protein